MTALFSPANSQRCFSVSAALLLLMLSLGSAKAERPIPPAFGPYMHLQPKDFADSKSFKSTDRIVGTYYFYWYNADTKEHIINSENGSDGLTDHPPTLQGFSYKSVAWHKKQLSDMIDAGIDALLCVFWGAPSERSEKAALYWSYAGLAPLVEAREQLLREGKRPPRIGLFYDTSTLQCNEWGAHIDLTTDYGKRWFYATVRDFFSAIPPKHWAMIDGKPLVLMYAAAFAKKHDQGFIDFTRQEFRKDFGGRDPYLAPQDSWQVKGDNVCGWGGALGLKNPGIGELGPGYDDTAVFGRKPLIAKRESGKFYAENWLKFLRRPSNFVMIETWSEFHEGTEICESKEYGRQYIELTRKYVDLFKQGWSPPWPKGQFSGARMVSAQTPGKGVSNGLLILSPEDGNTNLRRFDDSVGWAAKPFSGKGAYIYFAIDDSFKWDRVMNTTVEVEYFDSAPGLLGIEYDGEDPSAPFHGVYSRSGTVELKGERIWKKATFKLTKAHFLNSQNGGADFRIVGETRQFAVRKVAVIRE